MYLKTIIRDYMWVIVCVSVCARVNDSLCGKKQSLRGAGVAHVDWIAYNKQKKFGIYIVAET